MYKFFDRIQKMDAYDERLVKFTIRSVLLRIQNKKLRDNYRKLIQTNTDNGAEIEWSAPLQHKLIEITIDTYEELNLTPITTDVELMKYTDIVFEKYISYYGLKQ